MHKQQGPTGYHRELYSISKDKHVEKNRKKNAYMCLTVEINTTL